MKPLIFALFAISFTGPGFTKVTPMEKEIVRQWKQIQTNGQANWKLKLRKHQQDVQEMEDSKEVALKCSTGRKEGSHESL